MFFYILSAALLMIWLIMKISAMRAFLISALVIIILYTLGLFLPIIMNSKDSRNQKNYQIRLVKFEDSKSDYKIKLKKYF